jgi:outer membrane protein assembly factor BamE (lipoprotein component of BamABCDE complex)
VSIGGCNSQQKFTRQCYETIYIGMPRQQVHHVLGEPNVVEKNSWRYVNEMPYYEAIIIFDDGCVKDKSFSNERPRPAPSR